MCSFSNFVFATEKFDNVEVKINNLAILNLVKDSDASLSEYREPVVLARHQFNRLDESEKDALTKDGTLKKLQIAEAKVLNLWIRDTPFDSVFDGGVSGVMEEQYNTLAECLGDTEMKTLVPNYSKVGDYSKALASKFQDEKRTNYAAAMKIEAIINDMQVLSLSDKSEVIKARTAYDALTSDQQAYVTNYTLLKDAENKISTWEGKVIPHQDVTNVLYAGARSSVYGLGTPWLSTQDWKSVTDDMTKYFPKAQPTLIWIIGTLGGDGCHLEFAQPNDGVDYRSKGITFDEPTIPGHLSHEDYFNYFDEHGIKVYLQVEPGLADVDTLMDVIFKKYGGHKCVAGFGVDVEWYYGVDEDSGLPVTDALAQEWETRLKSFNTYYRMFLKHYNARYLPPTYRGVNNDILFCDDSQSFGSMNGDTLGQYDENLDDVLGFIPEFKKFSECFPNNEVIYQIGYPQDAMWYATLKNPIIQTLGTRLAEVTKQNCGIMWVDFTLKNPLTFPQVMKDGDMTAALTTLTNFLSDSDDNMVGKRFAADQATYVDAMYVSKLRSLIDSLTEEERSNLDEDSLSLLTAIEAKALDIRIQNLPTTLREKDKDTVTEIRKNYSALSREQQKQVTELTTLKTAEKQIAEFSLNHSHGSNPNSAASSPTTVTTFVSDTTADFNVNHTYQFKITSTNGQVPTLVVGTAGIFTSQLIKTIGNDYYFKLIATGNAGARAGIYVNGVKILVATVAVSSIKSDTNLPFKVKSGATYIFRITAELKPTLVAGTPSEFSATYVKAIGKDYFFKVTAIGKVGAGCGFYINSQKAPVAVATIIN